MTIKQLKAMLANYDQDLEVNVGTTYVDNNGNEWFLQEKLGSIYQVGAADIMLAGDNNKPN